MLLCESFLTSFVLLREIYQKVGTTAVNINAVYGRSTLYESFMRYLNLKTKQKKQTFLLTVAAGFHGHKVQLSFLQ